MKKKPLFILVLVGSFGVSGCGPAAEPDPERDVNDQNTDQFGDGNPDVELTFAYTGADYAPLVEDYVAENPDIAITTQRLDSDDHHRNLFTALSAGAGAPDLAVVDYTEIETYKNAESHFMNLYDLGAEDIESDFLEWAWEIGTTVSGDFSLGIPAAIDPTVLYYRTDLFDEAGLPTEPEEVDDLLSTWDDYADAAETIHAETGKPIAPNPDMIYHAKRDQTPEYYFNEANELIIENGSDAQDDYFKTVEWMASGYTDHLLIGSSTWWDAMEEGAYATLPAPASMRDDLLANAPDESNWRIAHIPEGAGNQGGSWLTMPSQTDQPEETYALLKWLTEPEQQLRLFHDEGLFPANPDTYEEELNDVADYFGDQSAGERFAEAALTVEPVHRGPHFYDVDEEITIGLENVYQGADPENEWDEILQRIDRRIGR